jgi:HemY protein
MYRIILFLLLVALAAWGAAWIADQPGDVTFPWHGGLAHVTLLEFAVGFLAAVAAAMLAWSGLRALWRLPEKIRRARRERRHARGRHAITQGLLAIGHGDSAAARLHADVARRHAAADPLTLLLHAQSAQLEGNRGAAREAFEVMAAREDTRLLGLRGLFIEAQRADDIVAAVTIAEEALKTAPSSTWASQAVLGFRCARSDWVGALAILETNYASGLIDKDVYRRQRGVLLTARALELETVDRDQSRDVVMEAVKLAPTLVPAAVLAAKFQSEAHQIRRAMRLVEAAWLAQPHPDLADAYAHVKLGDSARARLVRMETLAAKAPGHLESALAVARAAIDASEFTKARAALASFIDAPTQRVAMLMAEIERTEHGDSGKARAWTLRAVRALHDRVWTADGYVSDKWRPVSPVSGRLDAFQWQTPVAALPSASAAVEPSPFEQAMLAAAPPRTEPVSEPHDAPRVLHDSVAQDSVEQDNAPVSPPAAEVAASPSPAATTPAAPAQVTAPAATAPAAPMPASPPPAAEAVVASPPPAAPAPAMESTSRPAPLFRTRTDIPAGAARPAPAIPAIIPIVRPPDDPGVDDGTGPDEFAEGAVRSQEGGWRGFLSRMRG